ncbi:hypothetical protein GH714_041547 [Hevea brasiliensis]|uniref:Uncharacterized protein n=1 Tax=Hevea brasiliensis TaxID=3981 RepID=A0A6A6MV83_HEVBR|nr:hypothetical protein GH714_041547 [Hevea brasiliensis]
MSPTTLPIAFQPLSSALRSRRKKEVQKTGRGKQVRVPEEEAKPPRTTHTLLQVLGGKAKRKKLLSPTGMDVRPMMEVVKGSAFDILQAAGGCPASLGQVAGWTCTVAQDLLVLKLSAEDVLRHRKFDFISVTPPYAEVDYGILMDQISKSALVGEDTFIVVEYPLRTDMMDLCGCLVKKPHLDHQVLGRGASCGIGNYVNRLSFEHIKWPLPFAEFHWPVVLEAA